MSTGVCSLPTSTNVPSCSAPQVAVPNLLGKTFVELLRFPDDSTIDYDRRDEIRGPAHHVLEQVVDRVRRLEADAAGVVHDPFCDERKAARRGPAARPVGQLDHPRLVGAATVHAEQPATAELDELVAVEYLDLEAPLVAERLRDVRQAHRRQVSRGRVREVAGEHRRAGHHEASLGTSPQRVAISRLDHDRDPLDRRP